jgi:two-component system NtrC family response regulator
LKTEDKRLLIVEDDPGLQSQLRWAFDGFEAHVAGDRATALAHLRRLAPGVITLDLGLPPDPGGVSEGFELLGDILKLAPESKVIVVTGHNDASNAVRAVGMGAYDFFEKPIDPELLSLAVVRAQRLYDLEAENRRLEDQRTRSALDGLIAASPEMLKVCRMVDKLASADVSTLILGESGTGKELLVRALHRLGPRSSSRLVAINCAAIPESLLESELFGYEKGAFTGAVKTTPGKIEHADGGLLFLDEVGDLSLALQGKLLRFLQERVIERVGGRGEIPVDVRVVCATHRDLTGLIAEGGFREDLYYRISEAVIKVPPLRERTGDNIVLARAFLKRFSAELNRNLMGFSEDAFHAIEAHAWPGNVRELENRVRRAVIMAEGSQITADDLEIGPIGREPTPFNLREVREQAERKAVLRALEHSNHNVSHAADLLGITRPTLYNLMRKFDIKE